uniref:Uncharacterized protein n=1 Tax=Caenorhabditis tropicalis TaxID=1561998 RepID=A0A1I7V1D3_9PELO
MCAKSFGDQLKRWKVSRCRRWGDPMGHRLEDEGEATTGRGDWRCDDDDDGRISDQEAGQGEKEAPKG